MQGYAVSFYDIDWSPDSTRLVSGGTDRLVTIWNVSGGPPLRVLHGHSAIVFGLGWSPDGSCIASSGWDNIIRLWNTTTGTCIQTIRDSDNPNTTFEGVMWKEHLLVSGTNKHGLQLWDTITRSRRWVGKTIPPIWIDDVAWSPDGTRLASSSDDGNVYLWDAANGMLQQRLQGHHGRVIAVAWSPDGNRLASCGGREGRGELFVWDAQSGECVRALSEQSEIVSAIAWSPSKGLLVSGGSDGVLRWWDAWSGECIKTQTAHRGTIQSLRISPNARWLASCGDDGAVRIWDLQSTELLRTLRRDRPYERLQITGIKGLTDAQKSTLQALGAIEEGTTFL
jgi:WD40 repeat protein